jgi:hypothetical protein
MTVGPLIGALLLAVVYVFGHLLLPWEDQHPRRWLSAAAGASIAYVFLDVLPTLGRYHRTLVGGDAEGSPAEHRIYGVALAGFVFLYALDELSKRNREGNDRPERPSGWHPGIWLHIGGFALYSWSIGDALVSHGEDGGPALWLYVAAMMFHLLVVSSGLARDEARFYHLRGRWALAASVLVGWAAAAWAPLPQTVMSYLFGFVAGGVLMTSANEELPTEKDGRFGWFAMGAAAYSALLLLI